MKNKTIKPLLAPNDQPNLKELNYPYLFSVKMDGIRGLVGLGDKVLSRSLKPIPNKQIQDRMKIVNDTLKNRGIILDGEFYNHNISFQEIFSGVMTDDFEDSKTVKKNGGVKNVDLKFWAFDAIETKNKPFSERLLLAEQICKEFPELLTFVEHKEVKSAEEVEETFNVYLEKGYEGLILRNPNSNYKFGKASLKQNIIFKVKPFVTFDAKIIGVVQSTEVDPNAEKKINELGRSQTSRKKGDRILIEKASCFTVMYDGKEANVSIALTDEEKKNIWKNKESYIGKYIEYKGMVIGAKDVPRHPVLIRFRPDKD